jgi:hypothetical protein
MDRKKSKLIAEQGSPNNFEPQIFKIIEAMG